MFQMQMTVQLSRRTALGFAVGLWTDIMVNLCTREKWTRLTLRPATTQEACSVTKPHHLWPLLLQDWEQRRPQYRTVQKRQPGVELQTAVAEGQVLWLRPRLPGSLSLSLLLLQQYRHYLNSDMRHLFILPPKLSKAVFCLCCAICNIIHMCNEAYLHFITRLRLCAIGTVD